REIQVSEITKPVLQMCMDAAYHLPQDIYEGMKKGRETEESSVGRIVHDQIIKNAEIADAEDSPYCQDTGIT
ncbi:fumarate hydratase, partial [Veillonella parvula]|uniref:fumarate hydratase n=1 Tax=Veillonella parvula TaxID=29466 RepID=UPI00210BE803